MKMETKKCILIVSVLILILSGTTFTAAVLQDPPQNNTQQSPTIVVNGDGSSGTGDVTNTQVVEIESKQIQQGEGIIDDSLNEEGIVGESYKHVSKDANPM
jgi:hypothetical protein